MNIPPSRSGSTSSTGSCEDNESVFLPSDKGKEGVGKTCGQSVVPEQVNTVEGLAGDANNKLTPLSGKEISRVPRKTLLNQANVETSLSAGALEGSELLTGEIGNQRSSHTTEASLSSMESDGVFDDVPNPENDPDENQKPPGFLTRQRSISESGLEVPNKTNAGRGRFRFRSGSAGRGSKHERDSSPFVRAKLFKNAIHNLTSKLDVDSWTESLDKRRDQAAEQLLKELQKKKPNATRKDIEFEAVMKRTLRGISFDIRDIGLIIKLNKLDDQRNLIKATKLHIARDVLDCCKFDLSVRTSTGARLACRDEYAESEADQARFQYLSDLSEVQNRDKLLRTLSGIIGRPYVLKKDIKTLGGYLVPVRKP